MSFRMPDDPESLALVRRYVVWGSGRSGTRRYMRLLGVNPLREDRPDREAFNAALAEDARQIADDDLSLLLELEWRARLTAAWLIGLDRRTWFRRRLGDLLLDSELVHAGKSYCFALARFGESKDADILVAYLDRYLPRADCHYDQLWAIGALLHLDDRFGSGHAERFLAPDGLWHRSAFAQIEPDMGKRAIKALCDFADQIMQTGQ
ncbi:DUF6000 family protein [Actinomadura mexicana]|uniref:Uncharacterized protein n=1 Tax=Actinomadura mexicana TaxID=134959 RepID=A0A239H369_9ACTN|nr:DUF6000 family protein [Actinomadura mexicana]SNS75869.1 hypothetical protein SAMN06265355_12827 [Actinomadura mexicana]